MTINHTTIAKVAAGIASVGMLAISVMPAASFAQSTSTTTTTTSTVTSAQLQAQIQALLAQIAALQAQLSGSTASFTFTRNLTIGSRGSDVIQLQTFLIGKGFVIPAGATGYFGAQTRGALAAFQAANGIVPAAGYFGPITRGRINAMIVIVTPGPNPNPNPNPGPVVLHGGEATLNSFDLVSESGDIRPGVNDLKLATAKFDVKNGDINLQRADLEFQATSASLNTHPWQYLKSISVWDGSKRLATMDVSSQSAWDDFTADSSHTASSARVYRVSLTGLADVIPMGTTANLTFTANTQNTIDTANQNQTFRVDVPDQGIRAVDAAGINQYVGSVTDFVTLTISAALNGKLTISQSTSNPNSSVLVADTTNTSSNYNVFGFTARNTQNVDTRITDLTFNVATTTASGSAAANIQNIVRKATLTVGGQSYDGTINSNNTITFNDTNIIVPGNGSVDGSLSFQLFGQTGHFATVGESLTVSLPSTGVTAENASSGDTVRSSDITGTASGNIQTIAVNGGISVTGSSSNNTTSNAVLTYNSNTPSSSFGTFTLQMNVTALNNDVYIPKTVALATGSTTYAGFVVDPNMQSSTSGGTVTTSLSTTARSDNSNFYVVHAGTTETFTISVNVDPSATGFYQVGLQTVKFSTTDTDLNSLQALTVDKTNSQFHTTPLNIPNS